MSLIQSISSTLKTWVFKKKLLKFSSRFSRDPQACFYCPEMCRFSCPVAENLRTNTVTPRGKMSLLHLAERGFGIEEVAGSAENREWFLEQCTGCGRCTEFCVHEVDVASNLRMERARQFESQNKAKAFSVPVEVSKLRGMVLFCEPGRKDWWMNRPALLKELEVESVCDVSVPTRAWGRGSLSKESAIEWGAALSKCSKIWTESPETGWFFSKGLKEELDVLRPEVRVVWQQFFVAFSSKDFGPEVSVHESFHLSRLFPRLGYSIPMHERGFLPFHNAWNVIDCGGESFYAEAHAPLAKQMGERFLKDLVNDGRTVKKVVCQNWGCVEHLKQLTTAEVTYWLDELH